MSFIDSILAAFTALRANVMRSVLTTLGIIIGVAAVIVMISVGAGAEKRMAEVIDSLGSNLLLVVPGTGNIRGVRLGRGTIPSLTEDDAKAILREVDNIEYSAPAVRGTSQIVFGNQNWSSAVYGITPDMIPAREWKIASGRALINDELKRTAKVALLGETVVEKLFGEQDPVGAEIRIRRVPFKVIGTLQGRGETPTGRDQDDIVFVPMTTAKKRLLGGRELGGKTVSMIVVKVSESGPINETANQVSQLLRQRHGIRPGQADDFSLRNLAEFLKARAKSSKAMAMLLAIVASVSLVVGGIGIMNIMLVSVTERTREIGLRMALGAESRDILTQFLIESVTLSLIGGVAGIVLGVSGSLAVASLGQWPAIVQPESLILAFGFAATVGMFFGFYPARKASRLNPIEALRYE
jgi:putative ABC transport system permease protein